MTVRTFDVVGLTCNHCVSAVTDEVRRLPGVTAVEIELVAGGTSRLRVSSDSELDEKAVAAALDEAGEYELA